jgi:hypothetical protein
MHCFNLGFVIPPSVLGVRVGMCHLYPGILLVICVLLNVCYFRHVTIDLWSVGLILILISLGYAFP